MDSWRSLAIVVFCVQCVACAGVVRRHTTCQNVHNTITQQFKIQSSHLEPQHSQGVRSSVCTFANGSAVFDCCGTPSVDDFVRSSNLLLSTFNNSNQLGLFKSRISLYEQVARDHKPGELGLWNATLEGISVLRNWGTRYWDPQYLADNHVFSNECVSRVASMQTCGGCSGEENVRPCKSLCNNVVIGCLKSPLAEYIESPWKHAVNSVRTAIRLVITASGDAKQNTQQLQDLVQDLNDWREPFTWWVQDYKTVSVCEDLPTSSCWNGETVGKYEFGTSQWKSSYNPEFLAPHTPQQSLFHELETFRNQLVHVRKSLEKFWPTTMGVEDPPRHTSSLHGLPPKALALSSSELPTRSLTLHEGSGDDSTFESDDEDLPYGNSGYGPLETDDEELTEGSGSGMETPEQDVIPPDAPPKPSDRPPANISSGETLRISIVLAFVTISLVRVF